MNRAATLDMIVKCQKKDEQERLFAAEHQGLEFESDFAPYETDGTYTLLWFKFENNTLITSGQVVHNVNPDPDLIKNLLDETYSANSKAISFIGYWNDTELTIQRWNSSYYFSLEINGSVPRGYDGTGNKKLAGLVSEFKGLEIWNKINATIAEKDGGRVLQLDVEIKDPSLFDGQELSQMMKKFLNINYAVTLRDITPDMGYVVKDNSKEGYGDLYLTANRGYAFDFEAMNQHLLDLLNEYVPEITDMISIRAGTQYFIIHNKVPASEYQFTIGLEYDELNRKLRIIDTDTNRFFYSTHTSRSIVGRLYADLSADTGRFCIRDAFS
ncbi:MAG: hypothetical protein NDI94_03645 [Candidatus Woesearchaeota archaeon]|nr:hypothetical protein [Candidatus Woesearchaeota archaeon]